MLRTLTIDSVVNAKKNKIQYVNKQLGSKATHTWPISLSPSVTKTASLTSSTSVFSMNNSEFLQILKGI